LEQVILSESIIESSIEQNQINSKPMKKSVLAIVCAMATVGAYAQGTVNFANAGAWGTAPVFNTDGTTPLAGAGFMAELYGGADAASLLPVGSATPFLVSGFFNGGATSVGTVQPGATGSFQVRAWDVSTGTGWDDATVRGESTVFQVATGGSGAPASPPAGLAGLTSFSLSAAVVPEPTTVALGLIGAAALLLRRRK
jgi:hypothetical protein